jgi:carboxypeptidase Taq
MEYKTKLNQLNEILAEVFDLNSAAGLLGWDQQVNMPPGGAEGRGYVLGTLGKLAQIKFTSPEVGQLLDELEPHAAQLDPDSDEARIIKVTRRLYDKQVKVPPEWVVEFAQLTTQAHQVWAKARAENNFASFLPVLEKIVDLRRRYAEFFAPYQHIYDPLLDDFEPGMKTTDVKQIFEKLRPQQVALIKAIADRPKVDDSCLHQPLDEKKQWDFGVDVLTKIGYDWNRSRQDKAPHPFTQNFGSWDVRITTRVDPNFLNPCLFGTLHESGHAMYELGVDPRLNRTALAGGTSLAVHESQSRMWENLVGRSLPFWEYFYPLLQQYFPEQYGNVALETFYKAINKVQPSLIRVEADEATYNLHIMLRLEIEIALMEGKLAVKDLPEAWNSRMEEYLGLTPPNDAKGVLQDVHWSGGMIGYFSTYALGNLVSAQLWERINTDLPDLDEQIRRGQFDALRGWLIESIHQHGSKYEPQELVQRVTGSKIDPAPYVRYLQNKFGVIYGLE